MIKSQLNRCDDSFNQVVNKIVTSRIKKNIDEKPVSFRRVTKAIANMIMTDTIVRERLENAILEDDRRKDE